MGRINPKRKIDNIMKKKFFITIILLNLFTFQLVNSSEQNIYKKIDLFGEVLEKLIKNMLMKSISPKVWTQL